MKPALVVGGLAVRSSADTLLRIAARSWFVVAVAGQLIFAITVATSYGRTALRSDFAAWNEVLPHGYVAGDTLGNGTVAAHLLAAVFVMLAGAVQLVPAVRRRAPALHRWLGRAYLFTAVTASLSGLYMTWIRGGVGSFDQHVGVSVNAILILVCAALALRAALRREFGAHRRWALRLYLVVGGVWFFRILLMLWILVNGGPVGFDPDKFEGPALTIIGYAQYLLPLAVLQLYLAAERRGDATGRAAMAGTLFVLTVVTGAGIFAATMMLWLPRL